MSDMILFDLDGTLTDSGPGITRCVQYALASFGIEEPDLEKLNCGTFGRSGRGCARNQLWIRSGSDEADCGRTASVCVDPGGCQSKCGTSAKRGRKDRI